ncbi:tetratricopeptide repeat protein, partial [Actinoplanes sp. NPDC049118]|uniref:tetratricopeptide repeat protein n=1 Tax=Actinoplanes sp. NPDC049118 TaxID=3155769 RepID=UPI0033C52DB8
LDNARDTDQVNHLLPGSPTCLVIVTSRNRLSGLVAAGAVSMTVDLLSAPEARQLLANRIGEDRVAAEPQAVDEIIAACARLPLALAIVAARAAAHRQFTLALLAGELRQARSGLDAFMGENPATDARAVLSWSYHILSEDAARLFRLLGLHPGPDVTAAAAASLAALPVSTARRMLIELSGANLLAEHALGRFAFHDLLRAYAAEQVMEVESQDERQAALRRVLDHYLHTTHAADRRLYPYRHRISIEPIDGGATITELPDADAALAWFTSEHAVLLAAIDKALAAGFNAHASKLAQTFTAFLNYQAHWNDWASSQRIALEAFQRLGDRPGQALAHRLLTVAYRQQGRLDQAARHARQALALFEELGDQPGQTLIHLDLGRLAERQGEFQQALEHAQEALAVARLSGDRISEADALNWVGCYHSRLGFHEEAIAYCHQSLELHRNFADLTSQVDTWDSLGYAHHQLGQHQEAIACYRRALTLWRDAGDRYEVATTLQRLGDVHAAADDAEAARSAWRQARTILHELGRSAEGPSRPEDHHNLDQTAGVLPPGIAYVDAGRCDDANSPIDARDSSVTSRLGIDHSAMPNSRRTDDVR